MNLPYIIQVQICIALFWIAYRLFMRDSGAFAHNRLYLLGSVIFSFIIPALSIPLWPAPAVQTGGIFAGEVTAWAIPAEGTTGVTVSWNTILKWICGTGIVLMASGISRHIFRMKRSISRSKSLKIGNAKLIYSEDIHAPYSFFNYIFVNNRETESLPQIIAHETAHIRLGHSYDSVFCQLMLIVFWWNPFVWLWSRSLKEVHEYQADDAVLKQGFDSKQYITLLIGTLADIHPEFVSGFSYSLIKNRLLMMTKQADRFSKLRILAAIPVLASALLLFSFTEKATPVAEIEIPQDQNLEAPIETNSATADIAGPEKTVSTATTTPPKQEFVYVKKSTEPEKNASTAKTPPPKSELTFQKIDNEPFIAVEEMPRFQGGDVMQFKNWVMREIRYPAEAASKNIQGRVTVQFIVEADGSVSEVSALNSPDKLLTDETVRVVSSSPKWTPGKQKGQAVRVRFKLPIDFKLSGPKTQTKETVEPKDTAAEEIKKESQESQTLESATVVGYPSDQPVTSRKNLNSADPLVFINGKKVDKKKFHEMDSSKIMYITVMKAENAIKNYGEEGKNGVILVTVEE